MAEHSSRIMRIFLPLLVLALAGLAALLLVVTRPQPVQQERADIGVLVEVQQIQRRPHQLKVYAQGTVEPFRTVTVQPRISGRIIWLHDELIAGGLLRENEPFLRLDRRDYRLARQSSRTALARAESDLALEEGRQQTAALEWRMFADKTGDGGRENLALRLPQLKAAKAAVAAARVELDRAELDLERAELRTPFGAVVVEEKAALGSLLTPQSEFALLAATDRFRIRVAVPVGKLPEIAIPGLNAEKGSAVVVRHDMGEEVVEKEGRVIRLLPDIETNGRMARLLVEVLDPLNLTAQDSGRPSRGLPLLLGAYVDLEIVVPGERELFEIPRSALHNGNQVYLYSAEQSLAIREVDIAWRRPDSVLIDEGLEDGETIVVSRLAAPVAGMKLRLAAQDDTTSGERR